MGWAGRDNSLRSCGRVLPCTWAWCCANARSCSGAVPLLALSGSTSPIAVPPRAYVCPLTAFPHQDAPAGHVRRSFCLLGFTRATTPTQVGTTVGRAWEAPTETPSPLLQNLVDQPMPAGVHSWGDQS